jgi:AcrR family transcriptional regulator
VATTGQSRDRSRNRRGEGQRLRSEILAAATALLDASGDERSVTLRAVARRAGITAPSIYPHFPSQPAILLAVVRQGSADLAAQLHAAVEAAGDDPLLRLDAACRAYVEFAGSHPERYRTMFDGGHHPVGSDSDSDSDSDDLAAPGAEAVRILTAALTDCVTDGRSTSTDPSADASVLWVGLHGLAHQRAVATSYPWPADIVHRVAAPLSRLSTAT